MLPHTFTTHWTLNILAYAPPAMHLSFPFWTPSFKFLPHRRSRLLPTRGSKFIYSNDTFLQHTCALRTLQTAAHTLAHASSRIPTCTRHDNTDNWTAFSLHHFATALHCFWLPSFSRTPATLRTLWLLLYSLRFWFLLLTAPFWTRSRLFSLAQDR